MALLAEVAGSSGTAEAAENFSGKCRIKNDLPHSRHRFPQGSFGHRGRHRRGFLVREAIVNIFPAAIALAANCSYARACALLRQVVCPVHLVRTRA
jgi:hypothetical protein